MDSYNYSYNVLINRLEAFAAGHFLIRRFTHGQIDLSDTLQDDQYPFMHVTPDTIEPIQGGMHFGFHIMFADIPRDKEYKAEYQREVISDCIRLGQDLIAEVQNGLELFGFNVQLVDKPVFEPFMEEQKNTVTGVAFTIKLEVPWDWSACDIPAIWSVGGAGGSGGSGVGYGVLLQTNSVDNAVQNILNLVDGTGITITDNGNGSVTIDSSGGGGGGEFVSTEYNANHTTALGNQYLVGDRVWYNGNVYRAIANNDALLPTNTTYWTLVAVGYRLRQTPADWNASTGDNQILNKPTIPAAQVNSDWNSLSGVSEILNKPTLNSGTVTSVALTTPAAFSVTGSPITTSGTLAITGAGIAAQYVDGTGALQTFPTTLQAFIKGTVKGQLIQYNGTNWIVINGLDLDDLTDASITAPSNGQVLQYNGTTWVNVTPSSGGTVTSVALTTPAAFNVTGSPITTAGTLAITGAGVASQYIRGDGTLANFPTGGGGGASVNYYLNGSVSQGTIGGAAFEQLNKTAVIGAGTDFIRTNGAGNGYIAQFITDINDPAQLSIPSGNWHFETFFSASSNGGNPSFYIQLYKYDGATLTLIASNAANPELITAGTVIDLYTSVISVPTTVLTATDRIAIRIYVVTSGRTLTLHTEGPHLSEITTTFSTGITAINGLTGQLQSLTTGAAGADFGISSTGTVHTFNLPTASAANRGALSSADWATFNGKQNSIGLTTVGTALATLPDPSAIRYLRINADNTASALTLDQLKSDLGMATGSGRAVLATDFITVGSSFQNVTGLSFPVTAGKTYKWRATIVIIATATTNGTLSTFGPAGTTTYRFTVGAGVSSNNVNNGTSNNQTNSQAISLLLRMATADGIYTATASGTVGVSVVSNTAGAITLKAGSIIEYDEVL